MDKLTPGARSLPLPSWTPQVRQGDERPVDELVLSQTLVQQGRHCVLVEVEVNGQPAPALPLLDEHAEAHSSLPPRPVAPEPAGHGPETLIQSRYAPGPEGWLLCDQSVTVSRDDQPVVSLRETRQGDHWHTELTLFQTTGDEEHRDPVRPELPASEVERARNLSVEEVLSWDATRSGRVEVLQDRYGDLRGASILELGPFATTYVARALLTEENGNRYLGVDLNPAALAKQREVLDSVGGAPARRSRQEVADLFHLPVEDGSQDLVVAYASFPIGARSQDAIAGLEEVRRALKPGGEFLCESWPLHDAAPATLAHLQERFELVGTPEPGRGFILRKPGGNRKTDDAS